MSALASANAEKSAARHLGRAAPPETARAILKHETADLHQAMHHHPAFAAMMNGTVTMPRYIRLLASLLGFHGPFERALRELPQSCAGRIDPAIRAMSPMLRADLAALGMPRPEIEALPSCQSPPAMCSWGNVVGGLYVVEGASLGGKVIALRLDPLFGGEMAGRSFFLGRPAPDPLPWPEVCSLLEACAREGHLAEIVVGARRTFEAMHRWLHDDYLNV